MINIPPQKNWEQANQSDLFGNVIQTKNITFDTQGYLQLSNSPRAAMNEAIDADFDNPAVILFSDDYGYFMETWDEPFQVNREILFVRPTQITDANHPNGSSQSDAVWFGGLMPVTESNDVHYYDPSANTWTDTNISLTASGQHQLVNFISLSALAVANVNTVKLYATPLTATPTLITTLTISSDLEITSMAYYNQNLYIATKHLYGGHAFMYVWNGLGTAANQVHEADSNMIFSLCMHKNAIYCLTANGGLLKFNGAGFDLAAAFPIYYTDQALTDEANVGMYKNIMKSNGNLLYILISNEENDTNRLLSQPDGIWCYDENVGLYHRYSVSNALVNPETIATASVNTTTNQITVANSYGDNTEFYYDDASGTSIPELTDNTKYYVIAVDATHIQISLTPGGSAIDLTGTGNNSQKMTFYPNNDFGQFYNDRTTALTVIERPVTNRHYGTDVLWGAEVRLRTDSSTADGFMGTVAYDVGTRGYFITPKVFSDNVLDTLNKTTLKFSKFLSPLNAIIIKYRTSDDNKQYVDMNTTTSWKATWTSGTTFTTTETDFSTAVVGDEVEILRGAAAGLLAHITAISEAGGTYTVTIDETYEEYAAGDLSRFISRNWVKWKTIVDGDSNATQEFISEQLGVKGKFVQLKVELRGVRTRIEELNIDNKYRLFNKSN